MKCSVKECKAESDKHHIRTRGSGGPDDDWNILNICREHHVEIHKIGTYKFTEKYPNIAEILDQKGWVIQDKFGIKKLMRK